MTSLTNTAAAGGGTMTYSFLASKPGTYLYQSGTDPAKQARMGLFGVIVVRPSLGAQFAYNDPTSEFNTDDEVLVLLSEIDPYLNLAVEVGDYEAFDMNNYVPRYWMINGRGFPDSVADNFASWLPSQPYGALARVYPFDEDEFLADGVTPNPGYSPLPGLARYVSVGTETYPFHPHGNNGRVIGRDGNLLRDGGVAVGADLSFERFSIPVGPGQTWDVLYQWYDAEGYNGQEFLTDGTTPNPDFNPVTVGIPNFQNVVYGAFYSGSPYLGTAGDLPVGGEGFNQCGEYYIISHNHALYKITSWGVPMTGPITYLRIDPPQPNSCS